mgnify:CR=1 FL=1
MNNVIYEGFFVTEKLNSKLKKDIKDKHITTEFRPEITHEHLIGLHAKFEVVGYGINDDNEGYKVRLISCDNKELVDLYRKIDIPHITLSVSETGKPVNTRYLDFHETDSFVIDTVFNCWKGEKR